MSFYIRDAISVNRCFLFLLLMLLCYMHQHIKHSLWSHFSVLWCINEALHSPLSDQLPWQTLNGVYQEQLMQLSQSVGSHTVSLFGTEATLHCFWVYYDDFRCVLRKREVYLCAPCCAHPKLHCIDLNQRESVSFALSVKRITRKDLSQTLRLSPSVMLQQRCNTWIPCYRQ